MTEIERVWSQQDFDAIAIKTFNCELSVEGTEDDKVSLRGELSGKISRILNLDVSGRWLRFNALSHAGSSKLVLKLPVKKAWVVSVAAGRGDVRINNILARSHIMLGHGDVAIENLRGVLGVSAGHADVRVKNFVQTDVPERPPAPVGQTSTGTQPLRGDWLQWTTADWEHWGDEIGQRVGVWGEELGLKLGLWGEQMGRRFESATAAGRFFEHTEIDARHAGAVIEVAHGDLRCENIDANGWLTRIARGDIVFSRGKIGQLGVVLNRGDIESASVIPDGKWFIRTIHGDIKFGLPPDINTRFDMATRYGQIRSDIPLVRVTRQGPETQYGGRMVGTIGTRVEGKDIVLNISAVHGNIRVTAAGGLEFTPQQKTLEVKREPTETAKETDKKTYQTPLDVLKALGDKKLTVEEAERLLRELGTSQV